MLIPVTLRLTVIAQVALTAVFVLLLTVIVAVPFATAVTTPFWSTVATFVLLLDQTSSFYVTFFGSIATERVSFAPSLIVFAVGVTVSFVGL